MTGITLLSGCHVGRRLALCILRRKTTRVAGRALSIQARVIHFCRNEGDKIGVTGVTNRTRRNMVGLLARRIGPVMAGRTSARHNTGMRIGSRRPGGRTMTSATGCCGLNMNRRLGLRIGTQESAIVAGLAIGRSNTKLGVDRVTRTPLSEAGRLLGPVGRPRSVTSVTSGSRRNMRSRLARRPGTRPCMAGRASAGGTPKDTSGVTGLATDQLVCAIKNIAGRHVVKTQTEPPARLRLPKRHSPLPQHDGGGGKHH